jgi:hypothetical protein
MENATRYNYQLLDQFFIEYFDPEALGSQLDDIMNDLVCYAGCDEGYPSSQLEGRYFILRTLRDLFWELKQS